ncbi:MAG: SpoIIE family protein phosphatase [Candidatus Sericytochromatia bacterium]|nr:SpoIIE family protein phosphatase [Candidatus Sericytochromatia bacterium]
MAPRFALPARPARPAEPPSGRREVGALAVLVLVFLVSSLGLRGLARMVLGVSLPELVVEAPLVAGLAWGHTLWRRREARRRARLAAAASEGPDFRAIVGAFAAVSRESLDVQANTEAFLEAVAEALSPTHQLVVVRRQGLLEALGARGVDDVDAHLRRGPTPDEVTIPLKVGERLVGRLLLGPRANGADYSEVDLGLLDSLGQSLALSLRNAELFHELAGQERLRRELEIACDVQMGLLPKRVPVLPGAALAAHCVPALEVGGDLFDFVQIDATRWGVLVGDVAGKGVPAALMMAVTLTLFRAIAPGIPSPASTLGRLNKLVHRNRPSNKTFVAAAYYIYDARDGSILLANAGHPPPLVDGQPVPVKGLPLGINPKMVYKEVRFTLAPGSSLVVYSDGLEDVENEAGESLGHQRLEELFARLAPRQPGEAVVAMQQAIGAFAGAVMQPDDQTVTILRRDPRPAPPTLAADRPADERRAGGRPPDAPLSPGRSAAAAGMSTPGVPGPPAPADPATPAS